MRVNADSARPRRPFCAAVFIICSQVMLGGQALTRRPDVAVVEGGIVGLEECARLMLGAGDEFADRRRSLRRVAPMLLGCQVPDALEIVAWEKWEDR
ncbi:MAG: hypothetical protein ACLFU7_00600 [Armatimonadota bacterium]